MVETLRQARKLPHKSGPKAACRPDIRSRLTPPGSTLSLTKQALRPFRLAAAVPGTALKGLQLLFQGCGGILRATLQLVGVLAQIVELFFTALVANVNFVLAAHTGVGGPLRAVALDPLDEQGVTPGDGGIATQERLEAPTVHPSRFLDASEVEHSGRYVYICDELVEGCACRD